MTSDATGIDAPMGPPRGGEPSNESEAADAGTGIEAAGHDAQLDAMASGRDFHGGESQVRFPNLDGAAVHPGAALAVMRFVEIRVTSDGCVNISDHVPVWMIQVDDVDRTL